ncbi:YehS family protein [Flocculibacter collagenilyticus]|uniref:DUF1456 family protein n=1 Tax=Flocculibacter collagenilyticus TaxID=2744479 RepID=UPI0018F7B28A|nr:DUF1456 family protein [Flocculibacter collagenilyticus]
MNNNDILRRLRFSFEFNDKKMIALFASAGRDVTQQQLKSWLKKEDDPEFVNCTDNQLAYFLTGLIHEKRGKQDGEQRPVEKKLTNNIILNKLKIALNLKAEDIVAMLSSVNFSMSKAELTAFFRKPDHKHYRDCKDQVLRNFLQAIQHKYRKSPLPKSREQAEDEAAQSAYQQFKAKPAKNTDENQQAEQVRKTQSKPSKMYVNPNAKKKQKSDRNVLKLKSSDK